MKSEKTHITKGFQSQRINKIGDISYVNLPKSLDVSKDTFEYHAASSSAHRSENGIIFIWKRFIALFLSQMQSMANTSYKRIWRSTAAKQICEFDQIRRIGKVFRFYYLLQRLFRSRWKPNTPLCHSLWPSHLLLLEVWAHAADISQVIFLSVDISTSQKINKMNIKWGQCDIYCYHKHWQHVSAPWIPTTIKYEYFCRRFCPIAEKSVLCCSSFLFQ